MKKRSKRPCEWCGKLFDGRSGHQKYCSDACALEAKREQTEESRKRRFEQMRADGTLVKTCEVCGKKFESVRSDRRFCSPECRKKGRRKDPEKRFAEAQCVVCGKTFARKTPNQLCCSKACSKLRRDMVEKESRKRKRAEERPLMRTSLRDVAAMAARAGMSYGMYVSRMGL